MHPERAYQGSALTNHSSDNAIAMLDEAANHLDATLDRALAVLSPVLSRRPHPSELSPADRIEPLSELHALVERVADTTAKLNRLLDEVVL